MPLRHIHGHWMGAKHHPTPCDPWVMDFELHISLIDASCRFDECAHFLKTVPLGHEHMDQFLLTTSLGQ